MCTARPRIGQALQRPPAPAPRPRAPGLQTQARACWAIFCGRARARPAAPLRTRAGVCTWRRPAKVWWPPATCARRGAPRCGRPTSAFRPTAKVLKTRFMEPTNRGHPLVTASLSVLPSEFYDGREVQKLPLSPLSRRGPQARRGRRGPPYGDLSCVALSRMLRGCCGALLAAHILPQIVRVRRLTLTCSRGPLCGLPRATAAAADGLPACSSSWYAPTGPRACAA